MASARCQVRIGIQHPEIHYQNLSTSHEHVKQRNRATISIGYHIRQRLWICLNHIIALISHVSHGISTQYINIYQPLISEYINIFQYCHIFAPCQVEREAELQEFGRVYRSFRPVAVHERLQKKKKKNTWGFNGLNGTKCGFKPSILMAIYWDIEWGF